MTTGSIICFVLAAAAGTSMFLAAPSHAFEYPINAITCDIPGGCQQGDNRQNDESTSRIGERSDPSVLSNPHASGSVTSAHKSGHKH